MRNTIIHKTSLKKIWKAFDDVLLWFKFFFKHPGIADQDLAAEFGGETFITHIRPNEDNTLYSASIPTAWSALDCHRTIPWTKMNT